MPACFQHPKKDTLTCSSACTKAPQTQYSLDVNTSEDVFGVVIFQAQDNEARVLVYFNQKFPDEGMRYPEYNWELLDIHHPI
jgi:hypothetical protein